MYFHRTSPVAAIAMATVFAGASPIAAQETADGSSAARIVEPIRIAKVSDLDFGTLIPNGTGVGRVRIHARTGARRVNANITEIGGDGFDRAVFTVTGEPRTFVNLTTSTPVIALNGPGAPMRVDRIMVNRNNGGQRNLPQTFRLGRTGEMEVGLGGRLRVASDQAPGRYSGTFDLIVTYQ
ncbi:MAG: DUF4402 domain-containing protein [Pontixanthobacter sp.]